MDDERLEPSVSKRLRFEPPLPSFPQPIPTVHHENTLGVQSQPGSFSSTGSLSSPMQSLMLASAPHSPYPTVEATLSCHVTPLINSLKPPGSLLPLDIPEYSLKDECTPECTPITSDPMEDLFLVPPSPLRPTRRSNELRVGPATIVYTTNTAGCPKQTEEAPSLQFDFAGRIGAGCFSEVFRVIHRATGSIYAVKKSKTRLRGHSELAQKVRQAELLGDIAGNDFILRPMSVWHEDGYFFTQSELCRGGSVRQRLATSPPSHSTLHSWARDLLQGLAILHRGGLMHLDIKPANLMLSDEGRLKIGDMDLLCPVGNWHGDDGDKIYMAPELLQGCATTRADIFSAGLSLAEAAGLQLPLDGDAWHTLRKQGLAIPNGLVPATFAELIQRMCIPCHHQRPAADQLLPLLQD
eukprot:CAMPEP_0175842330 /NCGR_PEP_ID=MMETSP0107_2-20121207/20435_1 /TAXON_ID=195067 ORGANISM="Goniomonas pacifica, Strain CCMP1869" /NCGR_SAMPLE_ID=MMETSP0107_2 /ASSEMBLY_ACC=CAM_ASM_000203 /LENGTH=409 /DNA_ID=CAMNT_0017156417 /DNA_START=6 /DNA_END=1235 /DNA_ORIENTATION=-